MVTAVGNIGNEDGRLVLSPDTTPMGLAASLMMFSLVATGIMAVAVMSAFLGAWQVVPLSVVVVGAVGIGMRSGYLRAHVVDVVSICGETVSVDKRLRRGAQHYEFQRGWAQVVLTPATPTREWGQLFIRSHGRQVEIGTFLDDDERRVVANRLHRLMGPARTFGPATPADALGGGDRP